MPQKDAQNIWNSYLAGTCSKNEKARIEYWFHQLNIDEPTKLNEEELEEIHNEMYHAINLAITPVAVRTLRWSRLAVAASIVVCLSISFYFLRPQNHKRLNAVTVTAAIRPGGKKAILTLANGKQIMLSDTRSKQLATEAEMSVQQNNGGIAYHAMAGLATHIGAETVIYNEMTTPRGGTYRLLLSDGTQVWLNAASSIRYPTSFKGKDRTVTLTGEAYFEVAHNPAMPFKVVSKGQTVEVLGTHFDVMAYTDEPSTRTTLVEGRIKIVSSMNTKLMRAGQQSILNNNQISLTDDADLDNVIAWKNGYFKFNDSLKNIMRQIGRWYDVQIEFDQKTDQDQRFSGQISRTRDIHQLLKIMESTGNVHFKIEGREVIVMR